MPDERDREPTTKFGAPYNWCDSDCDDCPLQSSCPAGEPHDEPAVAPAAESNATDALSAAVFADVRAALLLAARSRAVPGAPTTATRSDTPVTPEALRQAAMDYAVALARVTDTARAAGHEFPRRAERAMNRAIAIVAPKVARISTYERPGDADFDPVLWRADSVPNLLLIEQADRAAYSAIDALGASLDAQATAAFCEARARLLAALAPWLAGIATEDRHELAARVADGQAPSPFARRVRSTP